MEYDRYGYIFTNLTRFEFNDYQKIINGLMNNDDAKMDNIINSLSFLMKTLEKYYHQKVMVFIDEYDTPFIEAHVNGFYSQIRDGLASLLHNSLKTSASLKYAMLTGIQRVAKENIFSDLNNLVVCTIRDKQYAQYFGFTDQDTKELLEYYGLQLNNDVKRMYNGYKIGNYNIYNPWSIINYTDNIELRPYWVNTSSNKMIKQAITNADDSFKREYESLIKDGYLKTLVQMETSFFEVASTPNLWGLFVNAGYLTISKTIYGVINTYMVKIPNEEVQVEFRTLTSNYLNVAETYLNQLFTALIKEDQKNFKLVYRDILLTLPSFHDLKDENSYHVLFLGMSAWFSNHYEIISNKEEGKRRCDIILRSKNDRTSYILEFKYVKTQIDADGLKDLAKKAITQILNKQYQANLTGKVICIGLAHHHKDVMIEWQER